MKTLLFQSLIFKILIILSLVIISIFGGAAYLFNQSDEYLIEDIRDYNLNSVMRSLDERLQERLALNKQQMEETAEMIVKNSSSFLLDYDIEGLKESLLFDMRQDSVVAVNIWDNSLKENFLTAVKQSKRIEFTRKVPENFPHYIQISKQIVVTNSGKEEMLGNVILYYDESFIVKKINQLKTKAKEEINKFDHEIDLKKQKFNMIKLMILFSALVVILFLISFLLIIFVNKPLRRLKFGLNEFFQFLQNKNTQINKISIHSNDEFGYMASSLDENIEVSARLHEEIYELNANLENKVNERTHKVTTLLNNADQGFLSFKDNLIINDEYSKECKNIFKTDIAGLNIAELLFEEPNKKEFFAQTLSALLKETNPLKIKSILSLLQSEFIINKKAIQVKYKIVDNNSFMLILTNVTRQKILEKKINKEKNILKMIVTVVTDSEEFFELYDEFIHLMNHAATIVDMTKTPLHNATEIYRIIHTYKGLFAQKEMQNTVNNLHLLETAISTILSNQDYSNESLQLLIDNNDFKIAFNMDLLVIKQELGEEFFDKRGKIVINEEKISSIEESLLKKAQKNNEVEEYQAIIEDIQSLKHRSIHSLMFSYSKLVDQLAQRLGKSIYPLEIIVDKELKVSDNFKPFIKSLVHVFRNGVDHGIESMDERAEIEKDEIGTINCSIKKIEDKLHIIIADDGRGVDIDKIKTMARKFGIDTQNLDNKAIYELIFNDQFSTKNEVSHTSGRGVGMAVVKNEIEKLNGSINIKTAKGEGTTFEFILPINNCTTETIAP